MGQNGPLGLGLEILPTGLGSKMGQNGPFYITPEWLDNNDIFMYSPHNKGKSVIAERFVKTLKAIIYKKMTANDSKSYLPDLNKIVDQ